MSSWPVGVDRGRVERRAQRALAGEDADQPVALDHRRRADPLVGQHVEDLRQVGAGRDRQQVGDMTSDELGEPVDALALAVGDHADRAAVLDHDDDAVRPLGQQRQRLAHGGRRAERDRGVVDRVPRLDPARRPRRRRRPGCPAGGRRGHRGGRWSRPCAVRRSRSCWRRRPGSSSRRRPASSGRPRGGSRRRAVRHHEDVGVGQVVGRTRAVEEAHVRPSCPRRRPRCDEGVLLTTSGGLRPPRRREHLTGRLIPHEESVNLVDEFLPRRMLRQPR